MNVGPRPSYMFVMLGRSISADFIANMTIAFESNASMVCEAEGIEKELNDYFHQRPPPSSINEQIPSKKPSVVCPCYFELTYTTLLRVSPIDFCFRLMNIYTLALYALCRCCCCTICFSFLCINQN